MSGDLLDFFKGSFYLKRCTSLSILSDQGVLYVNKSDIESLLKQGESIKDFHSEEPPVDRTREEIEKLDTLMMQEM